MEYQSATGTAKPEVSTTVRVLWSDKFLYLGYECPYTKLTVFDPPQHGKERLGLWDRDVVEAFIGSDLDHIGRYTEFEIAPTNEKLDLILNLESGGRASPRASAEKPAPSERDFDWQSGFESAIKTNEQAHVWTAEVRIPLAKLSTSKPEPGTRWRLNLYRCDRANNAFLAWNPTLQGSFHAPEKFGTLIFERSVTH